MRSAPALMIPLQRHSRVWLDHVMTPSVIQLANEECRSEIELHADGHQPFVARRLQPCDPAGCVPLGLRLPRTSSIRSLSFCVTPSVIRRVDDAMPLVQALESESVPLAWRHTLQLLQQQTSDIGVTLRVYGSLAWQVSTGVNYLAHDSDLDLLVRPTSARQARTCLKILSAASQSGAICLDGEMAFPDGRSVAWQELTTDSAHMLVKTATGIKLDTTESIWHQTSWQ